MVIFKSSHGPTSIRYSRAYFNAHIGVSSMFVTFGFYCYRVFLLLAKYMFLANRYIDKFYYFKLSPHPMLTIGWNKMLTRFFLILAFSTLRYSDLDEFVAYYWHAESFQLTDFILTSKIFFQRLLHPGSLSRYRSDFGNRYWFFAIGGLFFTDIAFGVYRYSRYRLKIFVYIGEKN